MATTVPGSMSGSNTTLYRTITAADASYAHAVIANAIDCGGLKRIFVVAELTAGSGIISIEPCLHVVTARTASGGVDTQMLAKSSTVTLNDGAMAVLEVYGRMWTLHVPTITASSEWKLHVGAFEPFRPSTVNFD